VPRAALGVGVAAALLVAGCGGGGGGKTLTKQQYASKLTNLCLVAADQVRELHLDNTVASWKADADDVLKIEQNFKDKLAALKAPDEIKDAADAYASANDKAFQDTKDAIDAAKAGDDAKLQTALKQANADDLKTWPPAKEIGAKGCYIS